MLITMDKEIEVPLIAVSDDGVEDKILEQINQQDVVSLDALIVLMPQYTWNQIFHTVDRLARAGKIALRRHRFTYTLFSRHYAA